MLRHLALRSGFAATTLFAVAAGCAMPAPDEQPRNALRSGVSAAGKATPCFGRLFTSCRVTGGGSPAAVVMSTTFRDAWAHPFDAQRVHPAPWTTATGIKLLVPAIYSHWLYRIATYRKAIIVEIPYRADRYRLYLVKARTSSPGTLAAYFGTSDFREASKSSDFHVVDLQIPITRLFARSTSCPHCNGTVVQEVQFDWNERGSGNAPMLPVKVGGPRVQPPRKAELTLRFDEPFYFALYDQQTRTVLLEGTVRRPVS